MSSADSFTAYDLENVAYVLRAASRSAKTITYVIHDQTGEQIGTCHDTDASVAQQYAFTMARMRDWRPVWAH